MVTITNPDWVPPIEETFDEGKPIRSLQGLMLAGNPVAMGLGKPGAARILGRALMSDPNMVTDGFTIDVSAADTYQLENGAGWDEALSSSFSGDTYQTASESFVTAETLTNYAYTGTLRFKATYKSTGTGRAIYVRLLLNGSVVNSWSANGTSTYTASQDVSIAPEDVVVWQFRAENSTVPVVFGHVGTFADDALYRIGAVAKRSDG